VCSVSDSYTSSRWLMSVMRQDRLNNGGSLLVASISCFLSTILISEYLYCGDLALSASHPTFDEQQSVVPPNRKAS
jgi:hypothetical protein